MELEFQALLKERNMDSKWVLKTKRCSDGSIERGTKLVLWRKGSSNGMVSIMKTLSAMLSSLPQFVCYFRSLSLRVGIFVSFMFRMRSSMVFFEKEVYMR
jgi:hypothetical protein